MATMFPRALDRDDVKSRAELDVFHELEQQLPNDWLAFHSVSWLVRDPWEGAKDGEIDFVLVHLERAIVCLEVKGGKIACDHGQWKRYKDGRWEKAKDPFTQALDHRHNLSRLIDTVDGWRGRDLLLAHAVAFPDTTVEAAMAPDGARDILIDSGDMRPVSFLRARSPRVLPRRGIAWRPRGGSPACCGSSRSACVWKGWRMLSLRHHSQSQLANIRPSWIKRPPENAGQRWPRTVSRLARGATTT